MKNKKTSLAEELTNRGLVFQHTGKSLSDITETKRTVYLGIDPTADSLHVGSLLPLAVLRLFVEYGHRVIILVGGATATIGDPSGKIQERTLMDRSDIVRNTKKIIVQVKKVLGTNNITTLDNYTWLHTIDTLSFLREVGKHFTVNEMLRKDSVRKRIEDPEGAISFTEFSYMLLQGYDYFVLHTNKGCDLQIGGSDQWGNITAGIELIRKKQEKNVHGITIPLLLDKKSRRKFGKTEQGTVWLDPVKTTPYQFYQFWYNVDDHSAIEYLKFYTLLSKKEIELLVKKALKHPEKRIVQTTLAYHITALVHSEKEATQVQNVSKSIHKGSFQDLTKDEKKLLITVAQSCALSKKELTKGVSLVDVLVESKLASSKREARRLIEANAVSFNNEKISDVKHMCTFNDFEKDFVILKKGKKDIVLLHCK